jgi:hypothetical protein
MLVKDEADVIEPVVRHLCSQVDEVIVADNMSSDDTPAILRGLADSGLPVLVQLDEEPGYWQSDKTTALAKQAHERGHSWVIPCDADEVWYSPNGRLGDVLDGLGPEWLFATAPLYYHVTTAVDDPNEADPTLRLRWRFREPVGIPKVASRLSADLWIGMGNHEAQRGGVQWVHSSGHPPTMPGMVQIRHFPWRSEMQFLRKIRNGAAAYTAAEGMPDRFGEHWRQWRERPDIAVFEWFRSYGFCPNPLEVWHVPDGTDHLLIEDPAPVVRPELWDGTR